MQARSVPGHLHMFITVFATTALLLIASSASAQNAGPSIAALEQAVAAGLKDKQRVSLRLGSEQGGGVSMLCRAATREGACAYTVELQGPIGRVQSAAAAAAKRYQRFTLADASDSLRAPVLIVTATPAPPAVIGGRESAAAPAVHIVLRAVDRRGEATAEAVQPLATETFPVEWSNLMGGQRSGQGVTARFALESVPPGDFLVIVVTEGKEASYLIQPKHRVWMQ